MKLKDTIGIFDNVFSKEECDQIINSFEQKIKSGEAIEGYSSAGKLSSYKKTTDFNLFNSSKPSDIQLQNIILNRFNEVLSNQYLDKYPFKNEFDHHTIVNGKTYYPALNLQKYEKNIGHYNAWHTERDHYGVTSRLFVFILYLNNVIEGGETKFLFKEENSDEFFGVKPEIGKLIIHPVSWPYIHKGETPISNDKYIATTWLQYSET